MIASFTIAMNFLNFFDLKVQIIRKLIVIY